MFTYYRDGTPSPGADAPRVYVRAWKLCCFHSLASTQTFRGTLTSSVNSRTDKKCPFSGVTMPFWQSLEEGAGKRCSQCAYVVDATPAPNNC